MKRNNMEVAESAKNKFRQTDEIEVLIEINGGTIQEVTSTAKIKVTLIDWDVIKIGCNGVYENYSANVDKSGKKINRTKNLAKSEKK